MPRPDFSVAIKKLRQSRSARRTVAMDSSRADYHLVRARDLAVGILALLDLEMEDAPAAVPGDPTFEELRLSRWAGMTCARDDSSLNKREDARRHIAHARAINRAIVALKRASTQAAGVRTERAA